MMSMMNYRLIYSKFYSIFPGGFIVKLSSPKVLNILGIILNILFRKQMNEMEDHLKTYGQEYPMQNYEK